MRERRSMGVRKSVASRKANREKAAAEAPKVEVPSQQPTATMQAIEVLVALAKAEGYAMSLNDDGKMAGLIQDIKVVVVR
jgi:hypothetical protein